jgi:hypothetical protein
MFMQNDERENMLGKIRLILKLENLDTYVRQNMLGKIRIFPPFSFLEISFTLNHDVLNFYMII